MKCVETQNSMAFEETQALATQLMERICTKANLNRAYKRVKANKGAAGIDGMTVDDLLTHLKENKEKIIKSLLEGKYQPQAVKGIKIPKPNSEEYRLLGVPTVVDRVIQQAILQTIEPILEPIFSESSYGFRPKRSAHQALQKASSYVKDGYQYVVDIDLEQFFDRVNHDILMSRLSQQIKDRRVLKVIGRFLRAGIMQNGIFSERMEGTPQGSPLSPLLSNVMLNELDRELEKRNHKFCRYADDCNIYVRSQKAGESVMKSIQNFLWKRLKLKLNEKKSAVALVNERKFLGYRIGQLGELDIAPQSLERMKTKIRQLTKRNRGTSLENVIASVNRYLIGWQNYFKLSTRRSVFQEIGAWTRRRLRCYRLKQRKRSYPIAMFLIKLGIKARNAWNLAKSNKGWWRLSLTPQLNQAMSNQWFEDKKTLAQLRTKTLCLSAFRN